VDSSVENVASLLVRHQAGGMMFTGDGVGHRTLAFIDRLNAGRALPLALDVFKVPHHGSLRNSQRQEEKFTIPSHVVALCGVRELLVNADALQLAMPEAGAFGGISPTDARSELRLLIQEIHPGREGAYCDLVVAAYDALITGILTDAAFPPPENPAGIDALWRSLAARVTTLHKKKISTAIQAKESERRLEERGKQIAARNRLGAGERETRALGTSKRAFRYDGYLTKHELHLHWWTGFTETGVREPLLAVLAQRELIAFFSRFTARCYVISADGTHGHPGEETLAAIATAAKNRAPAPPTPLGPRARVLVTSAASILQSKLTALEPRWADFIGIECIARGRTAMRITTGQAPVWTEPLTALVATADTVQHQMRSSGAAAIPERSVAARRYEIHAEEEGLYLGIEPGGRFDIATLVEIESGGTPPRLIIEEPWESGDRDFDLIGIRSGWLYTQVKLVGLPGRSSVVIMPGPDIYFSDQYSQDEKWRYRTDNIDEAIRFTIKPFGIPVLHLAGAPSDAPPMPLRQYFSERAIPLPTPATAITVLAALIGADNAQEIAGAMVSAEHAVGLQWTVDIESSTAMLNGIGLGAAHLALRIPASARVTIAGGVQTVIAADIRLFCPAIDARAPLSATVTLHAPDGLPLTEDARLTAPFRPLRDYLSALGLDVASQANVDLGGLLSFACDSHDRAKNLLFAAPTFLTLAELAQWRIDVAGSRVQTMLAVAGSVEIAAAELLVIPPSPTGIVAAIAGMALSLENFRISLVMPRFGRPAAMLSAEATLEGKVLLATASLADPMPVLTFCLRDPTSLTELVAILPSGAAELLGLAVPLAGPLGELTFSEPGFAITQPAAGSGDYHLHSVFFTARFDGWVSLLPAGFPVPGDAAISVTVFNPLDETRQVGFEVAMTLGFGGPALRRGMRVWLGVWPNQADPAETLYGLSLGCVPDREPPLLADILDAVLPGTTNAAIRGLIPILGNVLDDVELRDGSLSLARAGGSSVVQDIVLTFAVRRAWAIVSGLEILSADLELAYRGGEWSARVAGDLLISGHVVRATLVLPTARAAGALTFENPDAEFTITAMLECFGVPVRTIPFLDRWLDMQVASGQLGFAPGGTAVTDWAASFHTPSLDIGIATVSAVAVNVGRFAMAPDRWGSTFGIEAEWSGMIITLDYTEGGADPLTGSIRCLQDRSIAAMISDLLQIDVPPALQPLFGGLSLREMAISLDVETKQLTAFSLRVDRTTPLSLGALQVQTLLVEYSRGAAGVGGRLAVTLGTAPEGATLSNALAACGLPAPELALPRSAPRFFDIGLQSFRMNFATSPVLRLDSLHVALGDDRAWDVAAPNASLRLTDLKLDLTLGEAGGGETRPYMLAVDGALAFHSLAARLQIQIGAGIADTVFRARLTEQQARAVQCGQIADGLLGATVWDAVPAPAGFSPPGFGAEAALYLNTTQGIFALWGDWPGQGTVALLVQRIAPPGGTEAVWGFALLATLGAEHSFADIIPELSTMRSAVTLEEASLALVSRAGHGLHPVWDDIAALPPAETAAFRRVLDAGIGLNLQARLRLASGIWSNLAGVLTFPPELIDATGAPDLTLAAQVGATDPAATVFSAALHGVTVLDAVQFTELSLAYRPNPRADITLRGQGHVDIPRLGELAMRFDFVGVMRVTETALRFEATSPAGDSLSHPFGMFGITLRDLHLVIDHGFETSAPSRVAIEASVTIGQTMLAGAILLRGGRPVMASLTVVSLDIGALFRQCFERDWLAAALPSLTLTDGRIYYAVQEGPGYEQGFHVAANVEIFGHSLSFNAGLTRAEGVTARGRAVEPLNLGFLLLTGPDGDGGPQLRLVAPNAGSGASCALEFGLSLFGLNFTGGAIRYDKPAGGEPVYSGTIAFRGEIPLFGSDCEIAVSWAHSRGFRIEHWPVTLPDLDWAKLLRAAGSGSCGPLGDLGINANIFRNTVVVKLSLANDTAQTDGDPALTVLLKARYRIAIGTAQSAREIFIIELPDVPVHISAPRELTAAAFAEKILLCFGDATQRAFTALVDDPAALIRLIGAVALDRAAGAVITNLLCRNAICDELTAEIRRRAEAEAADATRAATAEEKAASAEEAASAWEAAAFGAEVETEIAAVLAALAEAFAWLLGLIGLTDLADRLTARKTEAERVRERARAAVRSKLAISALDIVYLADGVVRADWPAPAGEHISYAVRSGMDANHDVVVMENSWRGSATDFGQTPSFGPGATIALGVRASVVRDGFRFEGEWRRASYRIPDYGPMSLTIEQVMASLVVRWAPGPDPVGGYTLHLVDAAGITRFTLPMLPAGSRDATIPASALTADESYVVQVRAHGTAYETAPFLSSPIIYRALAAPAKVTIEHEAGTHRLSAVFEAVPGADRFIAQLIFAGGTAEEQADAALRRFVFDDVRINAGAEIRLRPGSQTAGGAQSVWGEAIALSLHDIAPPGRAALACWDPAPADIGGASRVAVRVAWPQAPAGITSEHLVTANGIAITPEITMLGDGAERLTATAIAVTTMLGATLRHRRGHSFAIGPTTDLAIRPPPANLRASSAQGVITAYWDATDGAQYALEILDGDRAALPRDPLLVTGGSVVVPFHTADLGRYFNLRVREVASSMFSAPLRIGVMLAPELADAVFDPAPPSVALALLAHAAHYGEAEFLTPDGKPLHRAPVVLVEGGGHVDLAELPEEVADAFAEELSVRCRAGRSDIWSDWSASVPIRFTAIAVPTELAPEMIGIGAIAIAWRSPLGARESIEIRAETGESLMDESEIGSIVRIDGHHKAATITGMRFAAQETAAVILAIHARRGELHSVSEPVTLQLESFAAPAITQADLGFTQQAASPTARLSLAWRDVTGVTGHQAEILSGGTRILGVENLSGNPATIDATALFHIARNLVGGDLSVRLRVCCPARRPPGRTVSRSRCFRCRT
jgi:hypothetical protein